ncbi:MAG: glutathione S-transferase family protein [Myxococcota bacterium]|nr:glutathione S-transferase family protein [Myxococcota bacterium]
MKLYTFPQAPNPRRVHVYLAEKGLEIPWEEVDILRGASRTPEYRERIDPTGRVPVLELDDGSHLAESVAICRYLEALHPEPPLFGVTPEARGRVEMWIRRIDMDLMTPAGLVWIHGSPLTAKAVKERVPEIVEPSRRAIAHQYALLDRELAERPFLAGDAYSMADIVGLTTVDFAAQLCESPPDPDLVHLARWHRRVSERPSARI